jgi:hypothetical protein
MSYMFNSAYVISRVTVGNKTIEKLEAKLAAKTPEAQALSNPLARMHRAMRQSARR